MHLFPSLLPRYFSLTYFFCANNLVRTRLRRVYPFRCLYHDVNKQTVTLTLAIPFLSHNVYFHRMRTDSFMLNMETRKLREESFNGFNEADSYRVFGESLKGLDFK